MANQDVASMRKPYRDKLDIFDVKDLKSKEPFEQFSAWFEEAKSTPGIFEANAMALATATRDGKPSVRMVLMKGLSKEGIDFYTNYHSRKAQDLVENPVGSLMFYWESLNKSVRIEGKVDKLSKEQSEEYFHSRPRSSQIGACVSEKQSSAIPSREVLDNRKKGLESEYGDESVTIPKPDYWGGFRLVPDRYEFWQGQSNRIHDRIVFRKPQAGESVDPTVTFQGSDGWVYERLQP